MTGKARLLMMSIVLALTVVVPSRASATLLTFTTTMDGMQEVPPTDTDATGYGQMSWESISNEFQWSFFFQDLSAPATVAHFHVGAPGVAGPVILPISGVTGLQSGLVFGSSKTVTQAFVDQLIAGNIYINIHSENFPGGEIRGQLTFQPPRVPEPATLALLGPGLLGLYGMQRWRQRPQISRR